MPVADADIVAYAALNKPTDDTSTNGGGIDIDERVVFTDLAANDDVEVLSSNAGDTMNITVTARNAAGETVSQTVALTGTTAVILSTMGVVERIQRALLASDAAGTVTVRRSVAGATIATIPPGERGFRRLFINAVSDAGGGKNYYEKIFLKNTHATLSALNATVTQSADPSGKVTHLLAASKGDSATSTNRLTAPAVGDTLDPDTFDDNSKAVPGTNLAAGEAIGVWFRLALNAAEAPIKSTYTTALNFSTA
ncbi:MAG: hypothetical protein H0U56_04205 [Methylibium sp.]|nr:hypothetical protein [Methylibium sp.]